MTDIYLNPIIVGNVIANFRKKKKLDADAFCAKFEDFYDETLEIAPATLNQPATLQEEFLIPLLGKLHQHNLDEVLYNF